MFILFVQLTCWASLNGILWAITLAGIWIPNFIGSNASRSNFCIVTNTSEHRQFVNSWWWLKNFSNSPTGRLMIILIFVAVFFFEFTSTVALVMDLHFQLTAVDFMLTMGPLGLDQHDFNCSHWGLSRDTVIGLHVAWPTTSVDHHMVRYHL